MKIRISVSCAYVLLFLPALIMAEDKRPSSDEGHAREAFLKVLSRPKVELDLKPTEAPAEAGGLVTEKFNFACEKKPDGSFERVPVLLVRPKESGKFPVVIVLHGTGGNKEGTRSWLVDFARRGIIGVAIDARYHGERAGGKQGSSAYVAAITRAWRSSPDSMEHPFYYDTCWDLMRLLDCLEGRTDIDAKRIGMLGISMGGIETWLTAAADERVAVAAPLISVQSFRWSLENERWQGRANTIKAAHEAAASDLGEPTVNAKVCRALWGKVIPGILDEFDCPNMLKLLAGRPLFIANGETDGNCPIEGARLALASAENAFDKAGCRDKLQIVVARGVGHRVTDEQRAAAIGFCAKWLKK